MNRTRLFARTPLRLALVLSGILVLAATLGALVGARLLEPALAARLDDAVRQRFNEIVAEYPGNDRRALVAIITRHASITHGRTSIYRLHASSGRVLVGDRNAGLPPPGLSTSGNNSPGAAHFRLLRDRIEDMDLVVGLSDSETLEIRYLVYRVAAFATLATLAIVIAGGAWLARRAQYRLDRLGASLDRVSGGELSTRLPLSGRGDDIDSLATNVNTMLDDLQVLVATVDQMSSDIAHDLKTPITRLFVSLEEALEQVATGQDVTESLLDAQAELVDINATFEAMLRLSRIERGARREHFTDIGLPGLLERVLEHWQPVAEDNGQTLQLADFHGAQAVVTGDPDLLVQLVVNLVANALDHCPAGARVVMTLEASDDDIVIQVSDNGPGIPVEERDKVFRRLYRLDRSRSTPGHGLGLSLVKAIATLHGGTVMLGDNAPGLVARVTLARSAHSVVRPHAMRQS